MTVSAQECQIQIIQQIKFPLPENTTDDDDNSFSTNEDNNVEGYVTQWGRLSQLYREKN